MVKHVRAVPASAPPGRRRMRKAAVATSVSVVGALLAIAGPTFATPAGAAPISNPTLTPFAAPASITVPNGVCRVSTVVTSGFGGADTLSTHVLGGDGATISATYRVRPGESLTFGTADGGSGGSAKGAGQNGAGGGQSGVVRVNGAALVIAGGGGGSGGDNAGYTAPHQGGDAGLPSTSAVGGNAVGNGQAGGTPGNSSQDGGGGGGGTAAGGAGGASGSAGGSGGSAGTSSDGTNARAGGNGGNAVSFAANIEPGGGGGGAGYSGGGGGGGAASSFPNAGLHMAGGGGGGSSLVAPGTLGGSPRIVSTATSEVPGAVAHNGNGYTAAANPAQDTGTPGAASATYQWHMCNYELGVAKSVNKVSVVPGGSVQWTIRVTNNGPDNMSTNTAAAPVGIPADRDTVVVADTDLPSGYTITTLPANCRSTGGLFPVTCFDIPAVVSAQNPNGSASNFAEIVVSYAVPASTPIGTCYANDAQIAGAALAGGGANTGSPTERSNAPNAANDDTPDRVTCVTGPDTKLTKTAGSSTVVQGGQITWTVTLTAIDPVAAGNIPMIVDSGLQSLPAGAMTITSGPTLSGTGAPNSAAGADCAVSAGDTFIPCNGDLAAGETIVATWVVDLADSGTDCLRRS